MELTQGMELAQVLKLSPGLLQSMEMLQMNTLELGAYLKELALENPVPGRVADGVLGVFAGGTVGPAGSVARIAGGVPVFGGVAGR